jgi:hypothetical protein
MGPADEGRQIFAQLWIERQKCRICSAWAHSDTFVVTHPKRDEYNYFLLRENFAAKENWYFWPLPFLIRMDINRYGYRLNPDGGCAHASSVMLSHNFHESSESRHNPVWGCVVVWGNEGNSSNNNLLSFQFQHAPQVYSIKRNNNSRNAASSWTSSNNQPQWTAAMIIFAGWNETIYDWKLKDQTTTGAVRRPFGRISLVSPCR